ncbi:MAG: type II toxin-antitoxin system RelE/ParE family toxin [Azospirillaceae bacterium]|nr:type II toxin-antitoxin system RelE/ParE family toxin [Azospirillaceae bacterium]
MTYRVIFSPLAQEQLAALYHYIAGVASPDIAAGYTEAIVTYCERLCGHPYRGTMRDDVRPGLRITNYRKRAVIAFDIDADLISIVGIFYGGQNYEAILQEDADAGGDIDPSIT